VLRAVLLSEPGSGSTTFVGLLYLAQTRLATERADAFRFSAPPESIRRLSALYASLVAGEFPGALPPEDAAQVRFEMAFHPPGRWRPFRGRTAFDLRYRAEFRWVRSGFDALAGALEAGRAVPGNIGDLRGCTTPIFLLDASTPYVTDPTGGATVPLRDAAMARILREVLHNRSASEGAASVRLHPMIVFTKLDARTREIVPGLPRGEPPDEDVLLAERARIGRGLMDSLIPETSKFCRTAAPNVDEPVPFFSYVRPITQPGTGTGGLVTRTLPDHRQEPVYPSSQYRALIDRLGVLCRDEP
jgi:hypothetical protein